MAIALSVMAFMSIDKIIVEQRPVHEVRNMKSALKDTPSDKALNQLLTSDF